MSEFTIDNLHFSFVLGSFEFNFDSKSAATKLTDASESTKALTGTIFIYSNKCKKTEQFNLSLRVTEVRDLKQQKSFGKHHIKFVTVLRRTDY